MAEKLLMAGSIEAALQEKDAGSAFLAGGTEINRLDSSVNARTLISIRKIEELKGFRKEGSVLWVGAAVTFQEAVEFADTPAWFKEACLMMASRTKRNMATIGGNIALLRDDSYIIPALLAAKASVVIREKSGAEAECCICKYIEGRKQGSFTDALILRVGLPTERRVQNKRYANTAMSHSALNISFGTDADGKNISIAAAIKDSGIYHLTCLAEKIEKGTFEGDVIIDNLKVCDIFTIHSDIYGSEDYKRYLLGATIAKMAADAKQEAK